MRLVLLIARVAIFFARLASRSDLAPTTKRLHPLEHGAQLQSLDDTPSAPRWSESTVTEETRTFARLCTSLTEEAEAIGWYDQRLALEPDRDVRAIMRDPQGEEIKHFSMDLEFLLRRTPLWREIAEGIPFSEGDIVEQGEEAEEEAVEGAAARSAPATGSASLGIGDRPLLQLLRREQKSA